jgi:hypothetical protein
MHSVSVLIKGDIEKVTEINAKSALLTGNNAQGE